MSESLQRPTKWCCPSCGRINDYSDTTSERSFTDGSSYTRAECRRCNFSFVPGESIGNCSECGYVMYQVEEGTFMVCANCGHVNTWESCPDHGPYNSSDRKRPFMARVYRSETRLSG